MTGQSDEDAADTAGDRVAERRTAEATTDGVRVRLGRLDGLLRPVNYARSRDSYRRPPRLYSWLSRRLGPTITSLGLSPSDVITLEVPGRRSGVIRRTTIVQAACDGGFYLVALAGESEWVRNVRAAGGRVVIGRRQRRPVRLEEVLPQQRAPVIRAYLLRWGRREGCRAVGREARYYFGVGADASLKDIERVAGHYPVFRILRADNAGDRPERRVRS